MVKIALVFALFFWYRFSWALGCYLTDRLTQERARRVQIATSMRSLLGSHAVPAGLIKQGDFIIPTTLRFGLFLALLYLGAYFVVQYLGLSL